MAKYLKPKLLIQIDLKFIHDTRRDIHACKQNIGTYAYGIILHPLVLSPKKKNCAMRFTPSWLHYMKITLCKSVYHKQEKEDYCVSLKQLIPTTLSTAFWYNCRLRSTVNKCLETSENKQSNYVNLYYYLKKNIGTYNKIRFEYLIKIIIVEMDNFNHIVHKTMRVALSKIPHEGNTNDTKNIPSFSHSISQ